MAVVLKATLFAFLFSNSVLAFCQGDSNKLKKIFVDQYFHADTGHCEHVRKFHGPRNVESVNVEEIFKNRFGSIKLFVISLKEQQRLEHRRDVYPGVYGFDLLKNQLVTFNNTREFIDFINSRNARISNLDKAYLYLLLYLRVFEKIGFDIQESFEYSPSLQANSEFANNSNLQIFFSWDSKNQMRTDDKRNTSIKSFDIRSEWITCIPRSHIVCWHQFEFDDSSNLLNVAMKSDTVTFRK